MSTDRYAISIVGSGPAGLSAAARAAEMGVAHILLETAPHLSNTIYQFQRRKHVMAEPSMLPLRSSLSFEPGSREAILETWTSGTSALGTNIRCGAAVNGISGVKGNFTLSLQDGESIQAETVVLAIGLQGNPRRLDMPGSDAPCMQYQLDDPEAYQDETIVVIGAGDSAIENALALSANNDVILVNRRDDFPRAAGANVSRLNEELEAGSLQCLYGTQPIHIALPDNPEGADARAQLRLDTPSGEVTVDCDRVIARLGAVPPRDFLERCGIEFPSDDPTATPVLSDQYETKVPGIYIVGALSGSPLIKQAMNQGYEVVESIRGNPVPSVDTEILLAKFKAMPQIDSVETAFNKVRNTIPLLSQISALQFRELLLESKIIEKSPGEEIIRYDDYSSELYCILQGEVKALLGPEGVDIGIRLRRGDHFGEMALISGRRRSSTILADAACVLLEIPRRPMQKLMHIAPFVQSALDQSFLQRALRTHLMQDLTEKDFETVLKAASLKRFAPNEALFNEGDTGDSLYLLRRGSVTVSKRVDGRDTVLRYVTASDYVGDLALLTNASRVATARASVVTEAIEIPGDIFKAVLRNYPRLRSEMQTKALSRIGESFQAQKNPKASRVIDLLMQNGVGEASDVLLIDESLCVRCDHCEQACAATHGGVSRLNRKAGPTIDSVHLPTSCRHCEHPHCMKDCPPDAIRRAPNGEVFIADTCIGCGNCVRNCPYGVIQMSSAQTEKKPNLLQWLLFGDGPTETEHAKEKGCGGSKASKAVKCDMCKDLSGGPACVSACPTGAAFRISPEQYIPDLAYGQRKIGH